MSTATLTAPASPAVAPPTHETPAPHHKQGVFDRFDRTYGHHWQMIEGKFWCERYPPNHAAYANLVFARNRRVVDLARGGKAVLDVGSGFGDILYYLRDKYSVLRGVDPSIKSCDIAADNFRRRNVGNDARFDQGLAEDLPYDDQTFDTVISLDTYEHVEPAYRHAALLEARRVLKPDGELIIVTPSRRTLRALVIFDNLLTMPRQIRWRRNPKLKRPIELFALAKKEYCEVFCTRRELTSQLRKAGYQVTHFERVSFYPAPERGGFMHPYVDARPPEHPLVRASVRFVNFMERLGIFNQKMLVVARPGKTA